MQISDVDVKVKDHCQNPDESDTNKITFLVLKVINWYVSMINSLSLLSHI